MSIVVGAGVALIRDGQPLGWIQVIIASIALILNLYMYSKEM